MRKVATAALVLVVLVVGFFAGAWMTWRASLVNQPPARKVLYWVDPMHPSYTSDKPGIAPDCGMPLEPVYADDPSAASGGSLPPGALRVPVGRQQLIGVRVAPVETTTVTRTVRSAGRVAVDENRIYRLVAGTEARVRSLQPLASGSFVQKDQVLLTFYANEFLAAQQTYFYALVTYERISRAREEPTEQSISTTAQLRSAIEGLRSLGMSDTQIVAIGRTRRLASEIELRSPVAGYITSRTVFPDQRLDRGEELYRIADLSHVWVLADLFESDAHYVRAGMPVRVSYQSNRGPALDASVSNVLPQFDPATRTMRVRLDIENHDLALRPDMFVDVEVPITLPAVVTVPTDAVVDSGSRETVFVDLGNGYFQPRRVRTGWRSEDRIEILSGLMEGERIVVSGNFLLDSESRMRTAAMGIGTPETDPICGMEVDQTKARSAGKISSYNGETYSFCSEQCKKKFEANPARYALPSPAPVRPRPAPGPGPAAERAATSRGHDEDDEMRELIRKADRSIPATVADAQGRSIFALDPVCGAEVDTTEPNVMTSVFNGKTYFFLARDCKTQFDRDPKRWAAAAEAPDAGSAAVAVSVPEPTAAGTAGGAAAVAPASAMPVRVAAAPVIGTAETARQARARRAAAQARGQMQTPADQSAGAVVASAPTIENDPVCGMPVDVKDATAARRTSMYKGTTYYFSSDDCKSKFDREPERYLEK